MVERVQGPKGRWFWSNLELVLGSGKVASFWTSLWADGKNLKENFSRLFQLCASKDGKVREMGRWVDRSCRWEVGWRRALLDREKPSKAALMSQLSNFLLKEDVDDTWRWKGNSTGMFSFSDAYKEISKVSNANEDGSGFGAGAAQVWKSTAPLKAQVTAWGLLWNKLPTTDKIGIFLICRRNEGCAATASWRVSQSRIFSCFVQRLWNYRTK